MQLIQLERINKLGRVGELLSAERLREHGLPRRGLEPAPRELPVRRPLGRKDGTRYLIGVKTRNEMR